MNYALYEVTPSGVKCKLPEVILSERLLIKLVFFRKCCKFKLYTNYKNRHGKEWRSIENTILCRFVQLAVHLLKRCLNYIWTSCMHCLCHLNLNGRPALTVVLFCHGRTMQADPLTWRCESFSWTVLKEDFCLGLFLPWDECLGRIGVALTWSKENAALRNVYDFSCGRFLVLLLKLMNIE